MRASDQESLVALGASRALAVAARSPGLMAAYLTYLFSDPGFRTALEANHLSSWEASELDSLLFALGPLPLRVEARDGMEDLWEGLETLRTLATEGGDARS